MCGPRRSTAGGDEVATELRDGRGEVGRHQIQQVLLTTATVDSDIMLGAVIRVVRSGTTGTPGKVPEAGG
jgi:hypothetical protein